jgi:hypothetical protein
MKLAVIKLRKTIRNTNKQQQINTNMARCKAVLKNGKRCSKNAKGDSDFCHIPAHQKSPTEARGKKRKASSDGDEPDAKRQRQAMVLKFINSGEECPVPLFKTESNDVVANIYSFLNSKEIFPLRVVHPTWTVMIDQNETMWDKLYTKEHGEHAPLHFDLYEDKLEELVPSFCDSMQKVYLKKSYMNLTKKQNLLKLVKKRDCKTVFMFSDIQKKQFMHDNENNFGDWSLAQFLRQTDDGCVFKYAVKNTWTGQEFMIYTFTMGDSWVGKVHIGETIQVYANIGDGEYCANTQNNKTSDEPDAEFVTCLEKFWRKEYNGSIGYDD